MQKSIIVENLSKNYFNKEAVREISFSINENERASKSAKDRTK